MFFYTLSFSIFLIFYFFYFFILRDTELYKKWPDCKRPQHLNKIDNILVATVQNQPVKCPWIHLICLYKGWLNIV